MHDRSLRRLLLLILTLSMLQTSLVLAANRRALVIGNSNYDIQGGRLPNAAGDAIDIADALGTAGFEVTLKTDIQTLETFEQVTDAFIGQLSGREIALFYYSGHGIQMEGKNYLIPTQEGIQSGYQVKHRALDVSYLIDGMTEKHPGLSLVVLDACRNNPFPKAGKGGADKGLGRMDAPNDMIIAYATAPNQTADDGEGKHSPYAQALLDELKASARAPIPQFFNQVGVRVSEKSEGKQSPRIESSPLHHNYCFSACSNQTVSASIGEITQPKSDPQSAENIYWQSIQNKTQAAYFESYLNRYPQGQYVELARLKLEELRQVKVEPAPEPVAVAAVVTREASDTSGIEMVNIPGGRFRMGASSAEAGSQADERPVHEVEVKGFKLGKYEVTREQFASFVDATGYNAGSSCLTYENGKGEERSGRNWQNPGNSQEPRHPVVCVNLQDAEAYIRWLNQQTGKRYRLPTEAEWEYAARGGSETARYWGESAESACRYANVGDLTGAETFGWDKAKQHPCSDGYSFTAPVGSFQANGFGLYDMLGNVWEWTCSVYTESGYNGSEKLCNKDATSRRVLRGGSWDTYPESVRAAYRDGNDVSYRFNYYGFRLAQDR